MKKNNSIFFLLLSFESYKNCLYLNIKQTQTDKKMETFTTITGKKINVSANHSKRTFTIRTESSKYRTIRLPKDEFQSCLKNTGNDWNDFLKSSDYYRIY